MSLRIINPSNSFVQFDTSERIGNCNYADISLCLPVFDDDDVSFQFVIQTDTTDEADELCSLTNADFSIGLVKVCDDSLLLTFSEKPERFRISPYQVLYNWPNGFPSFKTVIDTGQCFMIKVIISETNFCSNCFQRISSDCHTSVLEYGNDDNFAGFNYCNSGGIDSGVDCDPTFITFTNQTTLTIPYTAAMLAKYGNVPTIKCWIYDTDGSLVNMVVRQALDTYPPTQILVDLGGNASGVLKVS